MKLLVLGSTGLLGQALTSEAKIRAHDIVTAARSGADLRLDVTDEDQLRRALDQTQPDAVVNCTGLTDLAACEQDPGLAYRVNARPAALLAAWSRSERRPFVHVSTDHYFTEGGDRPHSEDEPVSLANEYARTKFAGERFALTAPLVLVARTSIVGIRGWAKPTLAEWAIETILGDGPVTLFDDAYTSSLDAASCARAVLELLEKGAAGLVNIGSREVYSKGAFIRALAGKLGAELGEAHVGTVGDLAPRRAASLGLDVRRAEQLLGHALPDLDSVAAAVVGQYKERAKQ
jgi:dTDP-4-dehydrorhamnose reductase